MGPRDYSTTAADNLSVGGISIAEGWLPASVNNAQREVLANTAKLLLDQGGEVTTTGAANAFLLDLPSAPTSYADNLLFICKLNHAVTGAATININGLGVKAFKKLVDGVASDLSAGDGPAGHRPVCIYSSADNAVLMLLAAPTFTHTGGETWPIQDRMKEQVYLLDFIPQSEHAAIRAGTSTYDCSDAFEAAAASITVETDNPTFYDGGPEVIFPYGTCYFSRTIEIKKTMTLTGHGIGARTSYASRLLFAPNITGITVNSGPSYRGDMDPPVWPIPAPPYSQGGNATVIKGLKLSSQSLGVRNLALNETGQGCASSGGVALWDSDHHGMGHGIWVRGMCHIQQCIIQYFPQHGIYLRAVALGSTAPNTPENRALYGNANFTQIYHTASLSNAGCGIYIDGPDTNACTFIALDLGSNKLSGVHESSLIGNTHIGHHTDNNGTDALCSYYDGAQLARYYCRDVALAPTIPPAGHAQSEEAWGFIANVGGTVDAHPSYPAWPFLLDGVTAKDYRLGYNYWFDQISASNLLLNPYTEGGQPHSLIIAPTIVVGTGIHYDEASTGIGLRATTTSLAVSPGMQITSRSNATREFITAYNRSGDEAIIFQVDGDGGTPAGNALPLGYVWDDTTGTWMIQRAHAAGQIAQRFTTTLNTITGGRTAAIGPGNTLFTQGAWIGSSPTNARHLSMMTAAPTTGEWAAGDLVLNAAPLMGEPWGWRCILTGTPGTWQPLRDVGSYQSISDVAFTLTPGTSPHHTRHTGTMTADRAVTLSTTGALAGLSYRIARTSGGAFNLNVGTGPLKALAVGQWCEVVYDGSAYYLSAFGSL